MRKYAFIIIGICLASIFWHYHERYVRYCAFAQGAKAMDVDVVYFDGKLLQAPVRPLILSIGDYQACYLVGEEL